MNCEDFKDKMVTGIFGVLKPGDRETVEEHVARCPSCEATYRKSQMYLGAFESSDDIPLPDWEESWNVIAAQALKPKRRFFPQFNHYRRLALAGAAVLVFTMGVWAGGGLFRQNTPAGQFESWAGYNYTSYQEYAENLDLVLINFANRDNKSATRDFDAKEKAIVGDILTQTRLLKQAASTRDDILLRDLLEDIEFILIGISNLGPNDKDSADQLIQFIQREGLKLKLNQLARHESDLI